MTQKLGGTFGIQAAQRGLPLFPHDRAAAGGAGPRHLIRLACRAFHHRDNLGNDLPRLAEHGRAADADTLFRDEILIVERGAAHGGARQRDRLKHAGGREHAGAAHVNLHVQQPAFLFLRRIFERFRPAREFCRAAQQLALREIIDLDDGAVDGIAQAAAQIADLPHTGDHLIHRAAGAV